jgi:hypothetical protein
MFMRKYLILHMNKPRLEINPQLTNTYTRERWINGAFEKNGSESAKGA